VNRQTAHIKVSQSLTPHRVYRQEGRQSMSNRIAGHARTSATEWIYRIVRAHARIMAKAKATSRTQRPSASGMNGRTAHVKDLSTIRHGRGKRKGLNDVFRFELQASAGRAGASYGHSDRGTYARSQVLHASG
jgi:hypothetical protein